MEGSLTERVEKMWVGKVVEVKGQDYVVETIVQRNLTMQSPYNSEVARAQMRKYCESGVCFVFDCPDFDEGDVVTEKLEEVRLRHTRMRTPLLVRTRHIFIVERKRYE